MDCRQTLVLALGLATGCVGCLQHTVVSMAPSAEAMAAQVKKERDLPKRQPQASTCVAFGTFSERTAEEPHQTPAQRGQLRDQARKAYQQALEIDPQNLPALLALARLYSTLEDHERALATYGKAAKAHPKQAIVWSELGMCHARKKEWEPAVEKLRKAVELDPENRSAANALGFCLARAGRYEESLAAFKKVGTTAEAHCNVARMLHHMKQDALSKQQVQVALQLNPELGSARQLLAELDSPAAPATPGTALQTAPSAGNAVQPASLAGGKNGTAPEGRGQQ